MAQNRFGIIQFQVNGEVFRAKGNFSYNVGGEARETVMGADAIHGYKVTRVPGFIEGEITDSPELSLYDLKHIADATVTLSLENGKMFVLREATQVGEADGNSEEGNIGVRFEGPDGEEIS